MPLETDLPGRLDRLPWTRFPISGLLLVATAELFRLRLLDARTVTLAWCVIFFFASAAANGCVFGGLCMLVGALVTVIFGVHAERRSLEDIALPLASLNELGHRGPLTEKE